MPDERDYRDLLASTRTVSAWTQDVLENLLIGREILGGPHRRALSDGRVQYYAYVRESDD